MSSDGRVWALGAAAVLAVAAGARGSAMRVGPQLRAVAGPPTATVTGLVVTEMATQAWPVTATIVRRLPRTQVEGIRPDLQSETAHRVRSAVTAAGFEWPAGRVTLHVGREGDILALGPESESLDLALAVAVLVASGQVGDPGDAFAFVGALDLHGRVRAVRTPVRSGLHATHATTVLSADQQVARGRWERVREVSLLAEVRSLLPQGSAMRVGPRLRLSVGEATVAASTWRYGSTAISERLRVRVRVTLLAPESTDPRHRSRTGTVGVRDPSDLVRRLRSSFEAYQYDVPRHMRITVHAVATPGAEPVFDLRTPELAIAVAALVASGQLPALPADAEVEGMLGESGNVVLRRPDFPRPGAIRWRDTEHMVLDLGHLQRTLQVIREVA